MSYPKDPRGYPPAFIALVETAALREVRIPMSSPTEAKRMEGRLHAFFGALHRAVVKDPSYIPVDNLSRQIRIKAVGSELVATPRDLEPDNALILAAIAGTSTQASDVSMSAEMAEMFAKTLTPPQ